MAAFLLLVLAFWLASGPGDQPPFGSEKPLREAVLLPGLINSVPGAHSPFFTRDGKTVYYAAERPAHGWLPAHNVLVVSHFVAGQWTPPAWMEFSGQNQEGTITMSPDGSRLYFWSYRSGPELESPPKQDSDIWYVERDGAGWGLPKKLDALNTPARDYMGSFDAEGNLYFSSTRDGGMGQGDIYFTKRQADGFAPPLNLGGAINTKSHEYGPAVSPDGQILVFTGDRPGSLGAWDLSVSFKKNGVWQPAFNPGRRINSVFGESSPRFSPDGKYLFFSSERSGKNQIYQIETDVLREIAETEPHPYASSKPMPEPVLFAAVPKGCGCITFAPDGKSAVFAKPDPKLSVLLSMRFESGAWTTPVTAGFSGKYFDGDPVFSPDGQRLFFSSRRPVNGREPQFGSIWYVEKTAFGWSEPKQPGTNPWTGSHASSTADGTVYYFGGGSDTRGATDVFRVPLAGGKYGARENLGEIVNGRGYEVDPFIARDGSFLIFGSDRPGGMGGQDLYISLNKEGRWGPPRNLGPLVNTSSGEVCPSVSPDGRYFFFTSDRGGQPGVYQVDIGVLRLGE